MFQRTKRRRRQIPAITRQGWWFLTAAVLVGAAALDAGVNLFFLVFGMMVCLLAAGVVLSELTLSGLQVRRVLPPVVHVGTPYLMGISLENRKHRLPSFSVEVEDLVSGEPIDKRCYFLKLPAGRTQETAYRQTAARRGRCQLSGFRLATKFPFGLVQRTRLVTDAQELIVYPALIPPAPALLRGLPTRAPGGRDRAFSRSGEFMGLRAFRPGDDPRDIHWRTSAHRGTWLVREHEDDEARAATVVLDNQEAAAPEQNNEAAFERAVSEAAGLCVELAQRGFSVELVTRGGSVRTEAGDRQIDRLLRALALVAPASGPLAVPRPAGGTVWIRPGHAPRVAVGPVDPNGAGVATAVRRTPGGGSFKGPVLQ